jgi:HEAT repeat protein
MKRQPVFFMISWLLLALLVPAASQPTAAMFKGRVTVMEGSGLSLKGRCAEICRQFAKDADGASFFTAWAFPIFERIHSCRRNHDGAKNGPLAVKSRNGRIEVNMDRDHSLNISAGPGTKNGDASWGVLIFLNQVEKGRSRISAMELLAPDREYDLGGERLAWLGTADETQGLEFIRGLLAQYADHAMREQLVFALYLFNGQAAVSELIGLARHDPDTDVRKEAIFWLGQKASSAAVKALGDVIASPEALEIKKHAVFALSQLPEETGTPLLLDIARRNPHARLRKEAIFWLGQSDDPRALDLFTEILTK